MTRIQFTPQAQRDLNDIWGYIAQENPDAADRLIHAIEEATRMLAELPGIGHTRFDVSASQYRFWRVQSYLIAYRVSSAELTVVRVIHGARDIRNQLSV